MSNRIKRISVFVLLFTMLVQLFGTVVSAEETAQQDIDLNDRTSILNWIEANIPEDLNELADMPKEWWDSLLPNQLRVAENLSMPVYRGENYGLTTYAYVPQSGDQVAYMNLSSTGIKDGYGNTLWKITNGGSNTYCLDHGASCKRSYAYGNFSKTSGEVAHLIEKYGASSTISGYFCIQMAIWALQSASTEAEAWSYAYTWYLKSYNETSAASWADTTVSFYKLAKGKTGNVWVAEGPAGSQRVAKYDEFVTTPYAGENPKPEEPNPDEPEIELVEPEFDVIEDSIEVSYEVKVKKTDWQTKVGLAGCKVEIYENGKKVKTVTTNAAGEASFKTEKSESFSAQYCTNFDLLTAAQQEAITCFTSLEEAKQHIEAQKSNFEEMQYTYQCKEITAPKGYVWQENVKSKKISGNETATLQITNERTLGAVELIKYDSESESHITQGDATLEGAVYGIYAAEDIVHQDQKTGVIYKKGELVAKAEIGKTPKQNKDGYILNTDGSRHIEKPDKEISYTDTPGKTLFGDLELGKYYIREITASEGYLPDKTKYDVTLVYKDQNVKVEVRNEVAAEAENTLTVDDGSDSKTVYSGDFVKKQGIQFVKTSDNAYQTELKPLKGAGFSIYLINDLSAVKKGELQPVNGTWGEADILSFYDYDFTKESRAMLYKRKSEPWTAGDEKWLTSLGENKYEVSEMFTDSDGRIETPELPYGTYVVVETTTPEHHKCAKPFIVQIVEDDRTLQKQRIINNTITETYLRIVKADEEFLEEEGIYIKAEEMVRGTVLKEGAQYRLKCLSFALSGESLKALNWKTDEEGYLTYYVPGEKETFGTNENPFAPTYLKKNGKIKDCYVTLPQKLPIGSYELVELTAPSGYVLNGFEQIVKDCSNEREKGYEIVDCPNEKMTFTIDNGSVYPDGQMGMNKYALYDSHGNLTVTILQENQEQKGLLEIYKHGEQLSEMSEEQDFIYQDAPIEGAKFQIIATEDIYTQELDADNLKQYAVDTQKYLLYKKGDIVGNITTDKNGWGYYSGLYIGKYKIVETVAGNGFVLNPTEQFFEITPQDQKISFDIIKTDYKNERQKIEIEVVKSDKDSDEKLKGAVYGLYAAEDIFSNIELCDEKQKWMIREVPELVVEKDTLIEKRMTDENGKASFEKDLPLGKYYLKELTAPEGYLLTEKNIEIDASYTGEKGGQTVSKQIHMAEYQNKISEIMISKQDITNGEEIQGAMLEVYEVKAGLEGVEELVLKEQWISAGNSGGKMIKGLPLETELILKETSPAPGYVTAEEIRFKLVQDQDVNGKLLEKTVVYVKAEENWIKAESGMLIMKDDVTKTEISKKDISNKKELPGATLEIYDESGRMITSWVSTNKPHYIEKLPIGRYRLVEKKAPSGYGYAEDVVFEIKDTGEIQTVEMLDDTQKVDVEKSTGQKVKPGEVFKYTIDIVKNCTDEKLDNFTLTDTLPKQVRLQSLSTGTYNQDVKYSVEFQTNVNKDWRVWKKDLNTAANYYLSLPKDLNQGEYITAFRFCFGTVDGRYSSVVAPEYEVKVLENGYGVLNNKIELTALINGETISDKDETNTPIETPKTPEKDHPKEPGWEEKETEDIRIVEYHPHVNTGDMTNPVIWIGIAGIAGSVYLAVRKQKKR